MKIKEKSTEVKAKNYDNLRERANYRNRRSSRVNPHILEDYSLNERKIMGLPFLKFNLKKSFSVDRLNYKRKKIILSYSLQSNW